MEKFLLTDLPRYIGIDGALWPALLLACLCGIPFLAGLFYIICNRKQIKQDFLTSINLD